MTPDFLFLSISILICGITRKLTKESSEDWLLNLRVPKLLIHWILMFGSVSILILLADEIGLFIEEWGYSSGLLGHFRFIESIPGIMYFLYLMNITLSSYALWVILEAQEFRSREADSLEMKRINVAVVLMFINLMLTITALQLIAWDVVYFETGIVIFIFLSISTLLSSNAATRIHLRRQQQPLDTLREWNTWLLLFGMVFLQTMITKAGLLLIVIPYTRQKILRFVSILLNRSFDIKSSNNSKIEDLANRISIVNKPALWGFYLLCTSGFTMLMIFQIHVSPFPPLTSGFLKTETISLIYTLDILFFCCALLTRRFTGLAVLVASALLITTRYLLLIFAPSFFIPSSIPSGFNTVEHVSDLIGSWAVPLGGIIIHLSFFTLFMIQSKEMVNKQAVLINNKVQQLKDLGIATILLELYVVIIFLVIGGLVLSFLWSPAPEGFEGSENEMRIINHVMVFILLVIIGFLSTLQHLPSYRKNITQTDKLFSAIKEWKGTEGINQMLSACPLLAHFGLWRQGHGVDWFLIIILLNAILFFGGAVLILFMGLM